MNPSILVLANRAESAEPTARCAASLGAPLRVRLTLLHLERLPVLLSPELVVAATAPPVPQDADPNAGLRALARRLPVSAQVMEAAGGITSALDEVLAHQSPLLLAMSLPVAPNLLDGLLSQVLPVLQSTHRPLLLVPRARPAAGPPRRVLVAVDGEPFTPNAAARALAPLLAAWSAAYTVAHILPGPGEAARSSRLALPDVQASGLLPPDAPLQRYPECYAPPVAGICQALADTRADLLVLIARPRSFLGGLFHRSVTAAVLRHCAVPVLLLPAEAPD